MDTAKSANPFNAQNIIDAQLIVEGKEDALQRLKKIQHELFVPAEVKQQISDAVEDLFAAMKASEQDYKPEQKTKSPSRAKKAAEPAK